MNRQEFENAVIALPFGKTLPNARYLYLPCNCEAAGLLGPLLSGLRQKLGLIDTHHIVKLAHADYAISFLDYPDFLEVAHPELREAIRIQLATGAVKRLSFAHHANPPILHRKETFLPPEHPSRELFGQLTRAEEAVGLYKDPSRIGFRDNWEEILRAKGVTINGHILQQAGPEGQGSEPSEVEGGPVIHRHRTALSRAELSKPIRTAVESGLLRKSDSFFDFGCGLGTDVTGLTAWGIQSAGWDPAYFPDAPCIESDFVNLGFVLNVIERPAERVDVLQAAWKLARRVMLVSTMVRGQEEYSVIRPHADGYLTSRGTFQKYFEPSELQGLIEQALECEAYPAGLGIYAVFRDPRDAQDWLAQRIRRPVDWDILSRRLGFLRPRIERRAVDLYESNRELLDACWERVLDLGRFPTPDEFDRFAELKSAVGSPRSVIRIFTSRFGEEAMETARQLRRDDLLAYLALANFRRKIPLKYLSDKLQSDIRSFFGTYEQALGSSRELLFSAGDSRNIEAACETFPHGLQDDDALQIHRSLIKELPAILRVYVLCAARVYGDPDDADIIKIHKHSGKVSFQYYENFPEDPFPPLLWRIKVNLRNLSADVFDHRVPPHQQLLCFKERFLAPDDPEQLRSARISQRLRRLGIQPEDVPYGIDPQRFAEIMRSNRLSRSLRALPADGKPS